MKTVVPKVDAASRKWYVVDAENQILGRLASQIAVILRGKHKPEFSPHLDHGDHIVVINAEKVRVTGRKSMQKIYTRYTGYPGGLKEHNFETLLSEKPERVLKHAVKGMLPKNRLGRQMFRKLKIYSGPEHPHDAQRPVELPSYLRNT